MTGHTSRFTKVSLTMLCVALGACSSGDRTATSDTAAARADSAAGRLDSAGAMRMDSNTMAMGGSWTNDRIFGFAHNADHGEIALGKLASTKATGAKVKEFAREMVRDHQMMMGETHALFTKLNAKPDSVFDDARDLMNDGNEKIKELTEKTAGADWDKNYIEGQVDAHQRILDKLTDAAKSSTDQTLTDGLAKASAKVQEHLTKAQSLKAAM